MGRFCRTLVLAGLLAIGSVFAEEAVFDVDVTLRNTFDKDFTNLPAFVQVFRVFGRGVDYTRFHRDGFHVYAEDGKEMDFVLKPVPPDFSLANDELVVMLPALAKGAELKLRFTNTAEKSAKEGKYDPAALVDNPNNLIPNGGFEKGAEGWEGGKIATDVVRSGKNALLLEVPGGGGNASLKCAKPLPFAKGMNYHFAIWAKCENVVRRTWRYHMSWALKGISGRITLSGDPLVFPEFDGNFDKNHLIRLTDDRDWFCYEANALSTLCIPQPALNSCQSTLVLNLNQENMPYLDAGKPARIWLDEALLFEQPQVAVNWDRIQKKLAPDGFFLYRRAPTCLNPALYALPRLDPPRPYEKIEKIAEAAAPGERKTITLGIHTAKPIPGLCLEVEALRGPNGATLGDAGREIEFNYTPVVDFKITDNSLEGWVIDGNAPRNVDRPGYADYLIGYRIPADAAPGKYQGAIKVKGDGKELGAVPLELEIVNLPLKVITDRLVGWSYNGNCDVPKGRGMDVPGLDERFYRYMARCNMTYLMMFCRFLPFKGDGGTDVDIAKLVENVKNVRDWAGITAGIGLYWDCALDKGENGRGLWTRSGKNMDAYKTRVKEMDEALEKAGLPKLVYMIWDEPRFCKPAEFGILKGTSAWTTSDINYNEACESIKQGLFTHICIDGPGCDYGPMFRKYAEKCGTKIGWDTQFGPFCNRYQSSLMMPNGAAICSCWHLGFYLGYHQAHQAYVRNQTAVGVGEGMIDLRYFETLQDAIAQAKAKGVAAKEIEAAEKYLKEVLGFCGDDHHFMSDIEVFTYNGGPERWGDDWFYDQWRTQLRNHALAIQKRIRGEPEEKVEAKPDDKTGKTAKADPKADKNGKAKPAAAGDLPPGFVKIKMRDGDTIVGKILSLEKNRIEYQTQDGKKQWVDSAEVTSYGK